MTSARPCPAIVSLACVVAIATAAGAQPARNCSLTTTGMVPLPDLAGTYRGQPGGLYAGGASVRPPAHEAVGIDLARTRVQPLDAQGRPDPAKGRIVFLSIGMSNTATEFGRFMEIAHADPARNPQVTIVNGAVSGQTADRYRDPDSKAWQWTLDQLARGSVTRHQVQVAWVKVVLRGFGSNTADPAANFPAFARALQADLETISRNLKINYPNIRIAYFSSRIRAYARPRGLSPEPAAYETGFAVRWAIERQIEGAPALGLDVAPWMSWGPYLWADGLTPRSDGLTYACADLEADLVHPGAGAAQKVADQLRAFLMTDPTAAPWFLRPASGPSAMASASASPAGGAPGVRIRFSAEARAPGGVREYVWSFGDGTHAYGPAPEKVFPVAGRYPVRVTAIDKAGNASLGTVAVIVR
jgi:hypothetical protein